MHKFNRNFFKNVSTEKQAYVLGFVYADGYNSLTQLSFSQLSQDKDILEKIITCMEADNTISYHIQPNGKEICKLAFSSRELCKDLTSLGAIQNKSLVLQFPDYLPDNLLPHFIRGYFDGDGCVWNGKRKKMIVKDPKRKTGYRERVVHNVKFTFTGVESFIIPLQKYLVEKVIVAKETKLNYSKAKNSNTSTKENVCTMEYSGRKQLKNLYNFMYSNATVYGNRKKLKFEEIFCALDEKSSKDTSLIAGTPEMAISSQASCNNQEEGSSTIPEMGVESSDSKCEALNR